MEVCVLGSGIIGLCTAFYLLEDGYKVTLVDNSRVGPARGASMNAGGFIASQGWHSPQVEPLAIFSFSQHARLASLLNGSEKYGWRECAAVGVRVGRTDVERSAYRSLPQNGTRDAKTGWLNNERQEDLTADGGIGQIDPDAFCKTLHEYMIGKGAQVVLAEPESLDPAKHVVVVRQLDGTIKQIHADRVLLSAGPWTARLAKKLNLPDVPVQSLPGHSLLIRPRQNKRLPAESVFAGISADFGVHASLSATGKLTEADLKEGFTRSPELFPRASGVVYVAGENTPSPAGPLPNNVDEVEHQMDERLARRLARSAALVSDDLDEKNGAIIERKQFCYRPITRDGMPILDRLTENVWCATGHGPWGITLAPGTGKVIAEMIIKSLDCSSNELSANVSELGIGRFKP